MNIRQYSLQLLTHPYNLVLFCTAYNANDGNVVYLKHETFCDISPFEWEFTCDCNLSALTIKLIQDMSTCLSQDRPYICHLSSSIACTEVFLIGITSNVQLNVCTVYIQAHWGLGLQDNGDLQFTTTKQCRHLCVGTHLLFLLFSTVTEKLCKCHNLLYTHHISDVTLQPLLLNLTQQQAD